jgi:hypothetical protein
MKIKLLTTALLLSAATTQPSGAMEPDNLPEIKKQTSMIIAVSNPTEEPNFIAVFPKVNPDVCYTRGFPIPPFWEIFLEPHQPATLHKFDHVDKRNQITVHHTYIDSYGPVEPEKDYYAPMIPSVFTIEFQTHSFALESLNGGPYMDTKTSAIPICVYFQDIYEIYKLLKIEDEDSSLQALLPEIKDVISNFLIPHMTDHYTLSTLSQHLNFPAKYDSDHGKTKFLKNYNLTENLML